MNFLFKYKILENCINKPFSTADFIKFIPSSMITCNFSSCLKPKKSVATDNIAESISIAVIFVFLK